MIIKSREVSVSSLPLQGDERGSILQKHSYCTAKA